MLDPNKREYLFRCEDCGLIVSVMLEEEDDLKDVREDKFVLACPCEGRCVVLRD
jgi:hypothetical protein